MYCNRFHISVHSFTLYFFVQLFFTEYHFLVADKKIKQFIRFIGQGYLAAVNKKPVQGPFSAF